MEAVRARVRHVLVDEFQDVSAAQYELLQARENAGLAAGVASAGVMSTGVVMPPTERPALAKTISFTSTPIYIS